jgi:hypothetical protein
LVHNEEDTVLLSALHKLREFKSLEKQPWDVLTEGYTRFFANLLLGISPHLSLSFPRSWHLRLAKERAAFTVSIDTVFA